MNLAGPGAGKRARSGAADWILVALLIGFYVLLPLDRGFPKIPLFGRPLNSAIAATLVVFVILAIRSRGSVLRYLRDPYCLIQSVYAGLLVIGALRAPSLLVALHWTVLYYSTFVLNYVILRHVTRLHGPHWLSLLVVALGVAAAGVSIVQGVLGLPLPMYDAWFEHHFSRAPQDYALATVRAAGTMNNPILYSVLMALSIPFAFDLQNTRVRALALFTIMFAAGLSGSRTAVFVVAVFAGWAFAVYGRRAVRAVPAVCAGLALLMASLTWLSSGQGSRLEFLVERLGFLADRAAVHEKSRRVLNPVPATEAPLAEGAEKPGLATEARAEAQAETSAALGVSLRQAAVVEGVREMTEEWDPLTWLIGRGSLTAGAIGTRLQPWYHTVDNVFLNVLYERGLSGLMVFMSAFMTVLIGTRRAAMVTLHWIAPVALAVAGLSFVWDGYSMFNILVVASMAITMWHAEQIGAGRPPEGLARGGIRVGVGALDTHDAVQNASRLRGPVVSSGSPRE